MDYFLRFLKPLGTMLPNQPGSHSYQRHGMNNIPTKFIVMLATGRDHKQGLVFQSLWSTNHCARSINCGKSHIALTIVFTLVGPSNTFIGAESCQHALFAFR
ncbi:MAG TPA: hypothetical protein DCM64_09685 [Gammaproteobacteria bacterium]|nr:hypothetical protein [Gammaproteobacteria bacterium]